MGRLLDLSTHCSSFDERKIADEFGYSQAHFRRHCRDALGESARSFLLRIRLERAAMRLAAGHSVASAGEACFETRETFTRAFASHFGCAPSVFQRLNKDLLLRFPCDASARDGTQRSVKIRTAIASYTTFLYDGPILLGRTFSDGRIDWRSSFRRDARQT